MLSEAKRRPGTGATTTYIVFGIFVGASIDQQPHTVRVATLGGIYQRRPFGL